MIKGPQRTKMHKHNVCAPLHRHWWGLLQIIMLMNLRFYIKIVMLVIVVMIFSHANKVAVLYMAISVSGLLDRLYKGINCPEKTSLLTSVISSSHIWSKCTCAVKNLNTYFMDWDNIWCRRSWYPDDISWWLCWSFNFSTCATVRVI